MRKTKVGFIKKGWGKTRAAPLVSAQPGTNGRPLRSLPAA